MTGLQGQVVVDAKGRRALLFTTPSGAQAVADLSIPPNAVLAPTKNLSDKESRRQRWRAVRADAVVAADLIVRPQSGFARRSTFKV
jgi:hypothetical protein